MKVIVNGVEIDIIGGSRLTYDVEADALSVDPIDSPKKTPVAKPKSDGDSEKPEKPDKAKSKLTQKELRHSVLEQLSLHTESVAQQLLTIRCLPANSNKSDQRYFKLLLDKMVEEKSIVRVEGQGRARYTLP